MPESPRLEGSERELRVEPPARPAHTRTQRRPAPRRPGPGLLWACGALLVVGCSSGAGGRGGAGGQGSGPGDAALDGGSQRPDAAAPGGDGGPPPSDAAVDAGAGPDAASAPDAGQPPSCKTSCEPGECGHITDNCGGTVNCGTAEESCQPGFACLAGRCTEIPPKCSPLAPAEACAGKRCGFVASGCNETIDCGAVNGGCDTATEFCQDHQCVAYPTPDPEDCPSLLTCESAGAECGVTSNGCGGTLNCGSAAERCAPGQRCEGNRCVTPQACVPAVDKATACAGRCGVVNDGCGGVYDCSTGGAGPDESFCASGQYCAFGTCVDEGEPPPSGCDPGPVDASICDAVAGACGVFTDLCGNAINCGTGCAADDEWCGGGGDALEHPTYGTIAASNLCGKPPCEPLDDTSACGARGPGELCGLVPKGCGQFADCGAACSAEGEFCGVDPSQPGRCAPVQCQPRDIAQACAGVCGVVSDGCSGTYDCDAFDTASNCDEAAGEVCGGYGAPAGTCGAPPRCVLTTCEAVGASCGYVSDGCEGLLDCTGGGANLGCDDSSTCMGTPPTCHYGDDQGCTGAYCDALPVCPPDQPVRLTGTVVTPGFVRADGSVANQFGIPNAVVYIPRDDSTPLPTIEEGPQCDRCEDTDLGPVLVSAVASPEGHFTLEGPIPTDVESFRLVVKTGEWRRVVRVPTAGMGCGTTTPLDRDLTRLPRNQQDGEAGTNIPRIAVSTGSSDAMECVFYKMGVDPEEFTVQGEVSGEGRIHIFGSDGNQLSGTRATPTGCAGSYVADNGSAVPCADADNYGCNTGQPGCSWTLGAPARVDFVPEYELIKDYTMLDNYDVVVLDCHGGDHEEDHDVAAGAYGDANLLEYTNRGGRVFMTHHSAHWIKANADFSRAATIGKGTKGDNEALSYDRPDQGRYGEPARLSDFASWLEEYATPTGSWSADGSTVMHIDVQGKDKVQSIASEGVHEWIWTQAKKGTGSQTQTFSFDTPYLTAPAGQPWCEADPGDSYCKDCGRITYSSFHVSEKGDSAGSSIEDLCAPREANPMDNQEKVLLYLLFDIAACTGGKVEPPACTPIPADQVCAPPVEGPDAGRTPCGFHTNGCGALQDCGNPCGNNAYCDDGYCREVGCTPQTCASLGFECGTHSDGCGGVLSCQQASCAGGAPCPDGCDDSVADQVCGLRAAGTCGVPSCVPQDVCVPGDDSDEVCGLVSDGCELVDCGGCPEGQSCGAQAPNRCGVGACTPLTCADLRADTTRFPHGLECGELSDGCGGVALGADGQPGCGRCALPETCGGDPAKPYVCSEPSCAPLTCDDLRADTATFPNGIECGFYGDGCGGTALDRDGQPGCGQCPDGAQCGAGGPGLCGAPCQPKSCVEVIQPPDGKSVCGMINDGCGVRDCGGCPVPGDICGAQTPNVCDPGLTCQPLDCQQMAAHLGRPIECGMVGDGCGGVQNCGDCPEPGESCGGGGQPNVCAPGDFTCEDDRSCAEILGVSGDEAQNLCGSVGNDCGELVQCGTCPEGSMCGRERPYRCGCVPRSWDQACGAAQYECGEVDDGCGGVVQCGSCAADQFCANHRCGSII